MNELGNRAQAVAALLKDERPDHRRLRIVRRRIDFSLPVGSARSFRILHRWRGDIHAHISQSLPRRT